VQRHRAAIGLRSLDAIHIATVAIVKSSLKNHPSFEFRYLTGDRKQHATFIAEGLLGELVE
jgi:hypothetical protein